MVYVRKYSSWEIGVVMAMQEAFAHICETYSNEIFDMGMAFHLFGRHSSEGWPMRTPGNRAAVPWTKIQFEDMEGHVYSLEHALHADMDAIDDAKDLLQERQERIEQLEDIILKMTDKQKTLVATNDKLVFKTKTQEAQIAGLQGQCAYLNQHLKKFDPWPAKKETPPAIKDKETTPEAPKKDPKRQEMPKSDEEETSMEKSSEELVDTGVKRRRTGNRKAYLAQFK
jgi:TolA-binding protein